MRLPAFSCFPRPGHGLSGTNYSTDGDGKSIPTAPIPNTFSRLNLLVDWVEKKAAPPMSVTVTAREPQSSDVFLSDVSQVCERSG